MIDKEFYISLPSNVSMNEFPNNKQSNYTTLLETPLEFTSKYQVCLKDISNFSNFNIPLGKITFQNLLFTDLEHREQNITFELSIQNGINLEQFCSTVNSEIAKNFLKKEYMIRYKLAFTNEYADKCASLNQLKKDHKRPSFNVIKKEAPNSTDRFEIIDKLSSPFIKDYNKFGAVYDHQNIRFVFTQTQLNKFAINYDLIVLTAPNFEDLEQEYNKNFFYQDRIDILSKNTFYINKLARTQRSLENTEEYNEIEKRSTDNPKTTNIKHEFLPIFKLHSANRIEIQVNIGKIKLEGLISNILNNSRTSIIELVKSESFYLPSKIQPIKFITIYTDIIEPQIYGNKQSPILRTVNIRSENDENTIFFDNPHYLNVNKTRIETINIEICDINGNNIQFRDFFSQIHLTLHFRKKQ